MKITKITINNLASIAGEHSIDFTKEPLKSAGIFAISGPTGSGKSTILDALCLALYDRIPRFQQNVGRARITDGERDISQTDVRNILRRGTGEGYAEVEFEDDNGVVYASRWSVRRSRGKSTGNLQDQRVQVINRTTSEELQGTKTELLAQLERLIGLSYDQFTRTVLLAQNDFATFLKSDENAKAELLEKLTGTDIYSKISIKLYELAKEKNTEVGQVKTQIEAIEILADACIKELTTEEKEKEKQLKSIREKELKANKLKETFDEIEKQQSALKDKEKELNTKKVQLTERKQELDTVSGKQKEFEAQQTAHKPQLTKATQLDALISENRKASQALMAKVTEAQKIKDTKQKDLQTKKAEQKVAYNKATAIYSGLQLNQKFDRMESVYTYLDELKVALQNKLNTLNKEKQDLGLKEVHKQQAELDVQKELLNQLSADFQLYIQESKALQELQKQLEADQKKELEAEAEKKKLTATLPELEKEFAKIKELYDSVQRKMNSNVEAIRTSLQENEACPVCGSTTHLINTQQVHTEHGVLKEEMKRLETEQTAQKTQLEVANRESLRLVALNKQNTTKLNELQKSCQAYKSKYAEEKFQDKYISQQKTLLQELGEKYRAKVTRGSQIQGAIDQLIKKSDQLQKQKDELRRAHDSYLAIKNTCDSLQTEYSSVEQAYQEKKQEYETKLNELKKLELERKGLLGGLSVADFQAAQEATSSRLKQAYETLEQQRQQLNTEQANLSGQLEQLNQSLVTLEEKVKGISKEDNLTELSQCKVLIEQLEQSLTTLKTKLATDKNNRAHKEKLEKSHQELVQAAEDWNKLNTLFGQANGAKFQVIAQSYTLRVLLLQANQHLKYLAPRYRLEQIGTDLALKIIDQDMGDAERTVYSLSGGESFLVSLALALGLSSLSSGNLQVDSLFIDEGFGSLDADSLRTAMDALEQLQQLGRKVGVISHVQEMSERIAVQIRLEKGTSGRSTLTIG